jgi:pimeloyl-ACP methyl ester carboxylesterase
MMMKLSRTRQCFPVIKLKKNIFMTFIVLGGYLVAGETPSTKSTKPPAGNQKNNLANNAKGKIAVPNLKEGEFTLQTSIPGNKEVKVSYIVPIDEKGRPLLTAHNIVFHAPHINESGFFKSANHRYFPEELGFTIFSLNIKSKLEDIGDSKKYYCFRESGWHDIVFKAQAKIATDFRLMPRKLLIVTNSAGGSMAQQMGINYPDKIDAIAMVGGRFFESLKVKSNIAWLSVNTWGCSGVPASKLFKEEADRLGMQVLRGETPPIWASKDTGDYHHGPSSTAWKLMQTFIRDLAKLRQKYVETVPSVEKWPTSEIINGEKQYFPSVEFASLWKQLPHEASKFLADENRDKNKPIIVNPPSQPLAVIFFIQDPAFDCSTVLLDNLYYFASKGTIAVSVEMGDDYFEALKKIRNALDFVLKNEKWNALPVYVAGLGTGGQLATIATLSNGDKRIKKITTFNSEYEWPFPELSISEARKRNKKMPLKMIFSSADLYGGKKSEDTEFRAVEANGPFFGDKWFALLDEACGIMPAKQ